MPPLTEVLYNARCPVCRAEIDHYAGYARARDLPVTFHDLNSRDLANWGGRRGRGCAPVACARGGAGSVRR